MRQCEITLELILQQFSSDTVCLYLVDSHCNGDTLFPLVKFYDNITFVSMPWNIDFNIPYEFAIILGFHGKSNSNDPLAHSFRPEIKSVQISSVEVGEITCFIEYMHANNVPVQFVSGTDFIQDELLPTNIPFFLHSPLKCKTHDDILILYTRYRTALKKALNSASESDINYQDTPINIFFYKYDFTRYIDCNSNFISYININELFTNFYSLSQIINKYNNDFQQKLNYIRKIYSIDANYFCDFSDIITKEFKYVTQSDLDTLINAIKYNNKEHSYNSEIIPIEKLK